MYAEVCATTPTRHHPGWHIPPPQGSPTNQYARNCTAKFDEGSNVVHIFFRDHEEAWDGYDPELDKSDKEDMDLDATPPLLDLPK